MGRSLGVSGRSRRGSLKGGTDGLLGAALTVLGGLWGVPRETLRPGRWKTWRLDYSWKWSLLNFVFQKLRKCTLGKCSPSCSQLSSVNSGLLLLVSRRVLSSMPSTCGVFPKRLHK